MQASTAPNTQRRTGGLPLAAWGILLLTVALSLFWSHIKQLHMDEFLALYTDSLPTFHDVLNVQLHFPINIDPPAYHLLTHASVALLGHNIIALRLPSLLGFLLFQVCLYLFVERFAGMRSALTAMGLSLITSTAGRERIYVQTFSQYALFSHYAPDPVVRSRLTLLTDRQQLQYEGVDTFYLLTENLRHFAPFPVVPYEEFLRLHGPLVLYYTSSQDGDVWVDKDLRARGRTVQTFGPWMQGYLAQAGDRP